MSESLRHIPDFVEDRFFVKGGAFAWHVMYRDGSREVAVMTWNDKQVARSRCRILNDLFYDAVAEGKYMDSYEHLKSHYDRIRAEQRTDVERQHDELLRALKAVVKSANPNPREQPEMFAAWTIAEIAIAKAEGK